MWNVSVSVWGICPYGTAFFLLILGYFIDTYVGFGLDFGLDLYLGMDSIVEEEDEDEGESEGKDKDVDGNREDWN